MNPRAIRRQRRDATADIEFVMLHAIDPRHTQPARDRATRQNAIPGYHYEPGSRPHRTIVALGGEVPIFTDYKSFDSKRAMSLILKAHRHAIAKHGEQARTPNEWLNYAIEELGETARAISEYQYRAGTLDQIAKEAAQTATLAIKIALMAEREGKKKR